MKKPPDPRIKRLIDGFFDLLKIRIGEHPAGVPWGMAGKQFKALLGEFSEEEIKRRIECWFQSTDPWIVGNQFKPTLFFSQFNKLKSGPIGDIYARSTNQKGGYIGVEAPMGKYAALGERKRTESGGQP